MPTESVENMKKTNMGPSPGTRNDTAPKGRYKSVILSPRQGTRTSSNSKLSPGYLHTFGFANSRSSSQSESSKPAEDSKPQTAVSRNDTAEVWLPDCNSLPPPPTTPPPPLPPTAADDMKEENILVLSESQLNVLSQNLSEIADRISPSTYDPMIEIDEESLEALIDENVGHSPETVFSVNSEQPVRFKTPYSRQRRDSKTYVSKQKSFTRKRTSAGRNDLRQEMNNNGEVSVDASNVLSFPAVNAEGLKQDSESDSGYSSSMSTSISLNEEIEAVQRLSSSTDIDADDSTFTGDDNVRKGWADNSVTGEFTGNSSFNQNIGNIKERLDSFINGASSGIGNLNLNRTVESSNTGIYSQTATASNGLDEQSASFNPTHNENIPTLYKDMKEVAKSPINMQKQTLDDTALPRTKTGKRPGLQRRRTTAMSFRPPKQMTVLEGESDIVEMDEAGFVQMLTDFKSLKTQLLKLKRELQEADVVSPLMHSHSTVMRRSGSFSIETDPTDRTPLNRKKMLLHRTMTMDSATMKERLCRTSSSPSTGGGLGNLNDIAETPEAGSAQKHLPESNTKDDKEINNLREELGDVKEKLVEITEERNSLMIAREELEHELDSKNHTIRMLQKQLESQTDSQDEMAYLKRQVKSLTNQIQQQQQKITELRYRATSPGPVNMGAHKKEAVKADIRNRLRDAFVKHLGESSKSNVQLSKYIQKAEQNISMAQKGLSSLYSSPHASTEHLPKDKSRPSFQRSDSQSSVERSQEDSDGREYESDSSRCSKRGVERSRANRNNEDSGSESGKSMRRRAESPSTVKSQDESDGIASDSDSGKSRRRRIVSPPFERNTKENKMKDSKTGEQIEVSDAHDASKADAATPAPRIRKLSRSKLLNKIEASPLSHSWTPGAIEKIVKSWRETKSPAIQEKSKEEEKTLKPVSHVQFL